ncbi:MAG: Hint domain-containing protein [Bdellovibrionales bacterium]
MKLNLNTPTTILLALVFTGCTATEFSSRELASSTFDRTSDNSSDTDSDDSDTASGMPPVSSLPESCQSSLRELGFELKAKLWILRKKSPCSEGIGLVEFEYTIEDSDPTVCDRISSISNTLEDAEKSDHPNRMVVHLPVGLQGKRIKASCAQSGRCAQKSAGATLGRLAWIKKCENQIAIFKDYLDGIRELEKKQNRSFLEFYPRIDLKSVPGSNKHVDEGPLQPVRLPLNETMVTRVDDLGREEVQRLVTAPCPSADDVEPIEIVCVAGCYRADQRILTAASGEYTPVKEARALDLREIAVLNADSTLEKPRYVNASVAQYTETLEDSQETLITIRTSSGLQLVVTTNHPLLDGEGIMREAADLKIGDDLVKADGRRDKIVSLERSSFFGRVYNVAPVSRAPEDNLVVSEGLINGSHHYQTELHQMLNRQVVRTRLADGI